MPESMESPSVVSVLSKLQETFTSAASSSRSIAVPKLTQLNDMVYEVHNPEHPDLEVVFFHGLQMKDYKKAHITTWMSRDDSHLWLRTWLGESFPKARILTISYDSSAKMTHESGRSDMYCTAENLLSDLTDDRAMIGQARCPVVLVGHCLGGLVLKELCLNAQRMVGQKSVDMHEAQRADEFLSNVRGMFFYGTPHTGSLLGDGLEEEVEGALFESIRILKGSSARRNEEFNDLKKKYGWRTSGLGESCETYVEFLGKRVHIVPEASARPYMDSYYSCATNHYDICKPDGKDSNIFQRLAGFLSQVQKDTELQRRVWADTSVSEEYVDLEGRAKQVCSMLAKEDTHTIFIVGRSGIGKTALAQQVFRDIHHNFALKCFISLKGVERSNVREEVLRKVYDSLEGVHKGSIRSHLSLGVLSLLKKKKCLMVLDNLESEDQLDVLSTTTWLEGSASRLIVTTTNSLLGSQSPTCTYTVPYLSDIESRQLFLRSAFRGRDVPRRMRYYIEQVIEKYGSFPLALNVFGLYLSNRNVHDKRIWLDLFDRMSKAQEINRNEDRLFSILQLSYDVLAPHEKNIFLDVAMMFHGFRLSLVECFWEACREYSFMAWSNLMDSGLVKEDKDGKIWMHEVLRDLGKSIACPKMTSFERWKRISETTFTKELITKYEGDTDTLLLKLQNTTNKLLLLPTIRFGQSSQLQCLLLEGVELTAERVELPESLVYFRWANGLFDICPVDFARLTKLVVLDLSGCGAMKSLPSSIVQARKLKWLELKGCGSLTELPEGTFSRLMYLGVKRTGIRKLPRSFRKSKDLMYLLASHTQLKKVPKWVGRLWRLNSLEISNTQVKRLSPKSLRNLQRLKTLTLAFTPLKLLPDSLGRLDSLKFLSMISSNIENFPILKRQLQKLEHLELSDSQLRAFAMSVGQCSLENLNSTLQHLVSCRSLKKLKLEIEGQGENLKLEVDEGQGEVSDLNATEEQSKLRTSSLFSCFRLFQTLTHLELVGTDYLHTLLPPLFHALQQMPSLHDLSLASFNLVEVMPSELGTLTRLKRLGILGFEGLRGLPESLGMLCLLTELILCNLPMLSRLPESLGAMKSLSALSIIKCGRLQSIPRSFGHMPSLEGESSTSQGNKCTPSGSTEPPASRCMVVNTDSWRLLECLMKCCSEYASSPEVFYKVHYRVECLGMDKVMKKAIKKRRVGFVLNYKEAMRLLRGEDFACQGRDSGRHEAFGSSTSHSPWHHCGLLQAVYVTCLLECDHNNDFELCVVHPKMVRLKDPREETDEDTDEETDNEIDQDSSSGSGSD